MLYFSGVNRHHHRATACDPLNSSPRGCIRAPTRRSKSWSPTPSMRAATGSTSFFRRISTTRTSSPPRGDVVSGLKDLLTANRLSGALSRHYAFPLLAGWPLGWARAGESRPRASFTVSIATLNDRSIPNGAASSRTWLGEKMRRFALLLAAPGIASCQRTNRVPSAAGASSPAAPAPSASGRGDTGRTAPLPDTAQHRDTTARAQ
jgi:hypothetical protein